MASSKLTKNVNCMHSLICKLYTFYNVFEIFEIQICTFHDSNFSWSVKASTIFVKMIRHDENERSFFHICKLRNKLNEKKKFQFSVLKLIYVILQVNSNHIFQACYFAFQHSMYILSLIHLPLSKNAFSTIFLTIWSMYRFFSIASLCSRSYTSRGTPCDVNFCGTFTILTGCILAFCLYRSFSSAVSFWNSVNRFCQKIWQWKSSHRLFSMLYQKVLKY